jgi:4-alpha-glucanotransferase
MRRALEAFVDENRAWVEDFALFRALKRSFGEVEWTRWSDELRDRQPDAIARARRELADEIEYELFCQLLFDRQWRDLRAAASSRGIGLIGDIPIFVAHDSADVWQHRELFRLGPDGLPTHIAGVPPDYFSATGQRWGNPLYRWRVLRKSGYGWWIDRLRQMLERFDAIRLDHFIGFQRYWEIPASAPTAVEGRWMKGPGAHFFEAVRGALGRLPLIAEDLGAVTPRVRRLRDRFHLPGIRLLQFAFGTDPSAPDFRPHNYPRRCVAYTGTHDNDTTVGWFYERGGGESTRSEAQTEKERRAALAYLGTEGKEIHWEMMRTVHRSVARLAIVPLQDVLGLGSEARMNRPGTSTGNWEWRFERGALRPEIADRLAAMTRTYERTGTSSTDATRGAR